MKLVVKEKHDFECRDGTILIALFRFFRLFWIWCKNQKHWFFLYQALTTIVILSFHTLIEETELLVPQKFEFENRQKRVRLFLGLSHYQGPDAEIKILGVSVESSTRIEKTFDYDPDGINPTRKFLRNLKLRKIWDGTLVIAFIGKNVDNQENDTTIKLLLFKSNATL